MRLSGSIPATVALMSTTWAVAEEPLALSGDYVFATVAQNGGRPVCTETWSFGEGGQMLVISGEEQVTKRYRFDHDRIGHWLITTNVSTNGLPDCMGNRSASVSSDEQRTYLVPFNSGVIMVCPEPTRMADGSPYISNCYANLTARLGR